MAHLRFGSAVTCTVDIPIEDTTYWSGQTWPHRGHIARHYHRAACAWKRVFDDLGNTRPYDLPDADLVGLEPPEAKEYRRRFVCNDSRTLADGVTFLLGPPSRSEYYCPCIEDTLGDDQDTWSFVPHSIAPADFASRRRLYALYDLEDTEAEDTEESSSEIDPEGYLAWLHADDDPRLESDYSGDEWEVTSESDDDDGY